MARKDARRIATSALAIVVCAALVGCFPTDQYSVVMIENRTETSVEVFLVTELAPEGISVLTGIAPGASYPYSNIAEGCSDAQLVAEDGSGTIIARSPKPICRPSVWVIAPRAE